MKLKLRPGASIQEPSVKLLLKVRGDANAGEGRLGGAHLGVAEGLVRLDRPAKAGV